jgi:hypothetical protein
MDETIYKHSKLKIIGMIGLVATTIIVPIVIFVFDIHGIANGFLGASICAVFGIMIFMGLFNEM